jgi:hypothetical protein
MADADVTTLDGNALAGVLDAVFGEDMTTAIGTCATCGVSGEVARVVVYARGGRARSLGVRHVPRR